MEEDLHITHVLYKQLDYLRVALAKHEVKGHRRSVALAPGYGRMDTWSGSLQYELEAGQLSLGTLSRRNVADGIRAFADRTEIPTPETLRSFDEYMKADIPDVSELFKDRNKDVCLRDLPAVAYDACDKRTARVSSLSLVRYRGNDYSVPCAYGHRDVLVRG